MKTRMKLLIAAALLAAPMSAQASPVETFGYVLAVVYHAGCEKLPMDFAGPMAIAMNKSPEDEVSAATGAIQKVIQKVGHEGFCARTKPMMLQSISKMRSAQ